MPSESAATVSATTSSDPVAEGSKSEEDYALEQAAASGQPYELVSARSESTDTWAQPDGSWSVKRYGTPVRLFRGGAWVPTDPNLVFAADGNVVPKATTVNVTFSGGGTGPLLTGVKDGRTLSLTWPKPLPTPTLEENVATYAEVLPGVDLQLKAEVEGFSQLLVIRTAEAAANPELALLKYKLDTVGLNVSTDADTGSISAVNPAGQTVFTSPSPLMWDSSSISSGTAPTVRSAFTATAGETDSGVPADAFDPPPGAQDAQMPTTITGDTLEIKPDQTLLNGENTTFPVFIDPSWAWGEKQNWTRVYKQYPNTSFWNTKDPIRVGYEAESGGSNRVSRSFIQLDTSDTKFTQVKNSVFRIRNTWSWSCQSRPVELWHTTGITKKTTWNNQPSKKTTLPLDTVDDSKGWSKDCAAGNLEFDTTAKIQEAASKGWSSITFGLYAVDETDTFAWKKFDAKTAVLETTYNNPPKTPTSLGTNPRTDCKTGGLIGNTRVSLYAKFDDKDAGNLTAEFQVFKAGTTTPSATQSLPASKGKITTWAVPDADLPTGDWTWKVRAKDQDDAYSPWSATCKFTIDRTRPSKPPLITSADGKFPPGDNGWPTVTGKAREPGTFTFAPNSVTDVVNYVWWTDHDPNPSDVDPGIAVSVRPPGYGPHFVYAYSVDRAGNRSDTQTYVYYAGRSEERDGPTDLNGDANSDIWSIDSNGTLLTYAGQGNGNFAAATNGGKSFLNASVDSRGDWGQDGSNDLVALQYDDIEKRKRLWAYPNNGSGVIIDDYTELTVSCPLPNEELGCIGDESWTGDDHWHNAEQIITAGDLNGDTAPDLLVKQGKFLWAYYGNRAGYDLDIAGTQAPVLVGEGDWDKFTLIAPGDVNGDKIADLWLREDATGDIWRSYGTKGANGYLDPTTWGNTAARVKIGSGYQAAAFPAIGSVGDVTGDNLADLWARKADNTMIGWTGKVPGTDNNSFGTSFIIDGITGGSRIPAGTTLTASQSLVSRSVKLTMQEDGNLTITSNPTGKVLWSSKTAGNAGAKAVMRSDGNLVVYKADGNYAWQSKTSAPGGFALLQDRGNLVVYNVKGQSQWTSNSDVRGDVNGDGYGDVITWREYADSSDKIHTLAGNSDGSFKAPHNSFTFSGWDENHVKKVSGDFNGDGLTDVAAMYYYPDKSTKMWTLLAKSDGTFRSPIPSWGANPGKWGFPNATLQAGDFNGDGRDDIAAWYNSPDGTDTLYTFTANVQGGFNAPFPNWSGTWNRSIIKLTTGDFNGDGRDDLAALADAPDNGVRFWQWHGQSNGSFKEPVQAFFHATWGDWNRTGFYAGDFNGDGLDDVATWYDYPDSSDKIHTYVSLSTSDGTFLAPKEAFSTDPGKLNYQKMKITTGDYNGDGRDDLGAMHDMGDGTVKMLTYLGQSDSTMSGLASWVGTWDYTNTSFITHNTP
ncbi:FG-GAP-like repeat-containing protein [Streptomyces sp. NPDC052016]|uniref:FG-GAP-like repeat-containing protein n=1 Tax=Streptomyces sp. NPDC052016 TaxID=3365680 RepID=UPI0037D60890